ncbi:MAG: hypothetical protein KDD36_07305 [Flavobacteriales bacterium]|nr:hypothetical protein [Flavobacteriales bacterium]
MISKHKLYTLSFSAALLLSAGVKAQDGGEESPTQNKKEAKAEEKAQEIRPPSNDILRLWSVGFGVGLYSFYGDVGKVENNTIRSSFSHFRKGVNLTAERRLGNLIGLDLGIHTGKISKQERSLTRNLNFESSLFQVDLGFTLHFDNDVIMDRGAKFTPYLGASIGYMFFNPKGDLLNANNQKYYYWSDGTIRNADESNPAGTEILRDYTYETSLDSTGSEYSHGSVTLPLQFGLKLKLGDRFDARIGASYNFIFSDNVDDFDDNGGFFDNDRYLYSNVALHYGFGGGDPGRDQRKKDKEEYKTFDFASIDATDSDGDGISDLKDDCPDAPIGVKSDSKGCPVDSDKDGVPDYRDQEPNSRPGSRVNAEGMVITDEMLQERANRGDTLAMDRSTLDAIYEKMSEKNRTGTSGSSNIPEGLRAGDKNNDGFISSEEITAVIDEFFEGVGSFDIEGLYRLIDYFFEQ